MKKFNKIAIIGVGLIGGSIGLAIKKRHAAKEVIGIFRHKSTLNRALKHKAIDRGVMRIKDGVKDADLIIVASPVYSIPPIVREAVKYAKNGAIITDVGSTKRWVVSNIERILKGSSKIIFVGSHPMAGSEKAGVEFAKADLLQNAPCIVTKTAKTGKEALYKVSNFWRSLGGLVKIMTPAEHDRSVSLISHLPHLVAFSLAGAVPEKDIIYAAEGFKDTTRVASSDPWLWSDIFLTNKEEILKAGRMFEQYYKNILKHLSRGDYSGVAKMLKAAKTKRDKFAYGRHV